MRVYLNPVSKWDGAAVGHYVLTLFVTADPWSLEVFQWLAKN